MTFNHQSWLPKFSTIKHFYLEFCRIFCIIGFHTWKYSKEKHKVENHPTNREHIRLLVRECECCGCREFHPLPKLHTKSKYWSKCSFNKESIINLEKKF